MRVSLGGAAAVSIPGHGAERRSARTSDRAVMDPPARASAVPADFVTVYEASYSRLVAQLTAVTGEVSEAEDVVQEAFIRAAQRWADIGSYDAPELWVRRVAINLAVSSLRRAKRSAALVLKWGRELEPGEVAGPDSGGADRVALTRALQELPIRYRAVLALHYLADLEVRAIAVELDIPESTVKTRLARGRRRLRDALDVDPREEGRS